MGRRNFYQILNEQGINPRREYDRLYELFYVEKAPDARGVFYTLKEFCGANFLHVPFRKTCISLEDFDDTYDYHFEKVPHDFDLNYLLSFCKYTFNLSIWLNPGNPLCMFGNTQQSQFYLQQVQNVIEIIGYMRVIQDEISIFVPKDRGAVSVSEIVSPEISYKVLEYNHYTMKGDIARKRETLRILADQLEPRRVELAAINKELENNVFFMFNNMNIRHNNCAEGDKNYKETVAKMSKDELENWYDETYQLCLLAFLELDNVERTKKVSQLKVSFGK